MGELAARRVHDDLCELYDRNYARGLTYARQIHKDRPLTQLMALLGEMIDAGTGHMDIHDRAWRQAEMDVISEMIKAIQLLVSTTEEDLP